MRLWKDPVTGAKHRYKDYSKEEAQGMGWTLLMLPRFVYKMISVRMKDEEPIGVTCQKARVKEVANLEKKKVPANKKLYREVQKALKNILEGDYTDEQKARAKENFINLYETKAQESGEPAWREVKTYEPHLKNEGTDMVGDYCDGGFKGESKPPFKSSSIEAQWVLNQFYGFSDFAEAPNNAEIKPLSQVKRYSSITKRIFDLLRQS